MHLLFDLDGTLTDSGVGFVRCVQHAFARLGLPTPEPEAIRRHVGPPLRESLAQLLGSRSDCLEPAVAYYRERYADTGIWETTLYPGIPEAIERLRGRARLLVVTSKPAGFAGQIVARWPFAAAFHRVHGSELDGDRADKRALIAHVLSAEGLDPARTVMIGDRAQDILGARHNGVAGHGVAWGYGSAAELTGAGAERIFPTPADLAEHFERAGKT